MPTVSSLYGNLRFVNEHRVLATKCTKPQNGSQIHFVAFVTFCGYLFDRLNRDKPAGTAFVFKLNDARYLREERIVLANADVNTRLEFRSTLANKDGATRHHLSCETLYAKPLRVTIAAIA
jgi:hypothetical protein